MKISTLIDIVIQSEKNMFLAARLQQLCESYWIAKGMMGVEKVLIAFVVEVLKKLDPILVRVKKEVEVRAVFEEYYHLEYEIDQLF